MNRAVALFLSGLLFSTPALARDTVLHIPLSDVLNMPEAAGKLDKSFGFYLAGQTTPKVVSKLSEGITSQKTNGVGKSDEFGCRWAALSALMQLQRAAKAAGANAVIDIVSNYKHNVTSSPTTLECHAGGIIIGVALKGTYAKLATAN